MRDDGALGVRHLHRDALLKRLNDARDFGVGTFGQVFPDSRDNRRGQDQRGGFIGLGEDGSREDGKGEDEPFQGAILTEGKYRLRYSLPIHQ